MRQADVELPDGQRFWHHVVHYPNSAAAAVVAAVEYRAAQLARHVRLEPLDGRDNDYEGVSIGRMSVRTACAIAWICSGT